MRVERLTWSHARSEAADAPLADFAGIAPAADVRVAASLPPVARRRRNRFLQRSTIRNLARALDLVVACAVVWALALSQGLDLWTSPLSAALPFLLAPFATVCGVWLAGGYRFRYAGSTVEHLLRVTAGALALLVPAYLLALVLGGDTSLMARVAAAGTLAMFGLHANYIGISRALTRAGQLSDNVVIVGATTAAADIVARNAREREINILGYFDDRAGRVSPTLMGDAPFLGGVDDLLNWERLPEVDRIVVTVTSTAQQRVRALIDRLRTLPQEVILVLDLEGFSPEQTSLARVVDAPAAYVSGAPRDARRAAMKRLFDVSVASLMLVCFVPVFAVIALLIKMDSPGPVFFRQKRHGFNNEIIRVWKFRTMRPESAEAARRAAEGLIRQTEADDPRVTRIGRFLRASSLDETPQLLNVLAGEMSLVGPRPHAIGMTASETEVTRIVGDYAHRHRMKPGITGWAQINGSRGPVHTAEEVRERVRLDMEYVRRASVWLDMWIVLMTAPRLLGDRDRAR